MEKKFKVGLIRVLTTEDQDILLVHEKLLNQYFPMLTVETRCIPDQYEGCLLYTSRSWSYFPDPVRTYAFEKK